MKNYRVEVLDKKTNKKSFEFVKYPCSVKYWQKIIKKDNVGANCVLANFEFDNFLNQIVMTEYTLLTLDKTVDIKLVRDRKINNLLKKI